ncbi:MAG: bifunctional diguanylate cyclase/phosphodiesterase, partial [Acidimicrobiia bacterium]|nr:bifunctional diguanylate cyclase/phosphodiesterase [Acidimicrobiia bacterium]
KLVNDSLGHTAGDEVLTTVADRLRAVTRPGDTIARVGADEFVIVCERPGSLSTILSVADRLTEAMREPFTSESGEVFLTASLGLALSTPDLDGPSLLSNADAAMYRAKQRGRSRLEMYDSAMQASAHDRLSLGSDLRGAVDRGELSLVYQPIVALVSGTVVGAEALCRWHHPVRGDVPPSVFIPVAEETGSILDIGRWVLETALSELAPLGAPGRDPFTLSVNVSARQLDDPALVARVVSALRSHGWPAEQLCLELTETALTEDLDIALRTLVRLRATGARIAVDDFGTGYSSLTHLQRLPIDAIKIDRSFVQGLDEGGGTDRSTIATAVLGIAQAMGLDAVAEGVETPGQLHALRELGCALGQGYLFSVPVPAEAMLGAERARIRN